MRAALFALAATTSVGCKFDLDEFVYKDARIEDQRFCRVSTTAQVCLTAERDQRSDFAWLQDNMFSTNCSGNDCHGGLVNGQPPSGKLILAKGSAYKTLLGKAETDPGDPPLVASELTTAHKLVEPGAPERSYLFFLLRGLRAEEGMPTAFEAPPADVGFMPQKNNTLCCQKLDAVARWIAAGAMP
jgi:hypothetical protein